jgi:Zn-dependent protease
MLRFSLFAIPVTIDSWFWIVTVFLGAGLGGQGTRGLQLLAIWIAVVFISILIHELGHALAGKSLGATPHIKLHGFGGTTYLLGPQFDRWQSILVTACGPLASLLLGGVCWFLGKRDEGASYWVTVAYSFGETINFSWTAFNLLPILPLDGGHILLAALGPNFRNLTSMIGFVTAASLAVVSFIHHQYLWAILLGILAYNNLRQAPVEGGVISR